MKLPQKVLVKVIVAQLRLTLCDPRTAAHQAPLSMDFPGKNTGIGCHFLLQGNLPDPGIKLILPVSTALQVDSLPTESLQKLSLMTFVYVQPTEGKT